MFYSYFHLCPDLLRVWPFVEKWLLRCGALWLLCGGKKLRLILLLNKVQIRSETNMCFQLLATFLFLFLFTFWLYWSKQRKQNYHMIFCQGQFPVRLQTSSSVLSQITLNISSIITSNYLWVMYSNISKQTKPSDYAWDRKDFWLGSS